MKPKNLTTKIFLDSGDPAETTEALRILGFLDGQTTNPSLVAKNPEIRKLLANGEKSTEQEIYARYREIVSELSRLVPGGSISIEVYADKNTSAEQMFAQGKEMFGWAPNAHVKYPILGSGLAAAEMSIAAGMRVNMTLCFTQEQAAAVYAATRGAKRGDVFVSPFVGRLDDRGEDGLDLIANILEMYASGDRHVEVLTASVRSVEHMLSALALGSDIITSPLGVLKAWVEQGMSVPGMDFIHEREKLRPIPFKTLPLKGEWTAFDIRHELTDAGIDKFSSDWNRLIKRRQ